MRIPDELYTILGCALWLNLLTTLYRFWPRRAQMQASAVSNHRDTVWTWKDTIWLIIILISTGLICALPFIFLTNSHTTIGTFLYCIIAIPVVVQFVSRVLPSAELIKRIVVGNGNGNLKLLERLAVIVLSILVLILHGLHADIWIYEFALSCDSSKWGDILLSASMSIFVSGYIFVFCALLFDPLKLVLSFARRLFSSVRHKRIDDIASRVNQYVNGNFSRNISTVKYIDSFSDRATLQKILLYPLVLPLFVIDIAYQVLASLFSFIVETVWYSFVIFSQIVRVFAKIGNWVLSLSDRTVIAISFRLAIILGLTLVVVCNSYSSLFRLKEESSAAFEFISSAIVIPVILEWVMSYKQGKAKTPKEEHHVSRPENP